MFDDASIKKKYFKVIEDIRLSLIENTYLNFQLIPGYTGARACLIQSYLASAGWRFMILRTLI